MAWIRRRKFESDDIACRYKPLKKKTLVAGKLVAVSEWRYA